MQTEFFISLSLTCSLSPEDDESINEEEGNDDSTEADNDGDNDESDGSSDDSNGDGFFGGDSFFD